jgi:striatin 1/3/4
MKTCTQEFTSHRRKNDEAICSVKYHSTLPYLMTAGADSTLKIYI